MFLLLACTLLCLRGWLLHSSGSVAEVQSHLDHFTRGTKGAERSHWPCTRQAELYASLTSLVWHFSCICPLPTPPYVTTTAVQKRIIVCRDINQMNSIWGQSAVSALSLLSQLLCKVTIMTECQKRAKCSQLTQIDILNKTETLYLTLFHHPSSDLKHSFSALNMMCVYLVPSQPTYNKHAPLQWVIQWSWHYKRINCALKRCLSSMGLCTRTDGAYAEQL